MASLDEQARQQLKSLGDFIRDQRQLAKLSLRDLAARTNVSNPYLSQVERGLHEPSVRVLKAIANALNVSAETLLAQAGLLDERPVAPVDGPDTEAVIAADARLTAEQRTALLAVHRSYVEANGKGRSGLPGAKKPRARARGARS